MITSPSIPRTAAPVAGFAIAALFLSWPAAGHAIQAPFPSTDSISLDLNLPAYRLTVRSGDSVSGVFPVAIGARAYPTPRGTFALKQVELNPGWIPPRSEWARDRKPLPPGPRNPMGRAKLEFHPTYYLHGTPEPESVGSPASHGCVRLENDDVLALARLLVEWGRPELSDSLEAWAAPGASSRRIDLARGAALIVRYDLIEVARDRIIAYPDPYRLRTDATDSLAALRISAAVGSLVPREVVTNLLDRAGDGPVELPLDSILAASLPPAPSQD